MRSAIGWILVGFGVAMNAASCKRAPAEDANAITPVVVTVHVASMDTLRNTITAPGTIVPALASELTVVAPEPARIAEMPVAEGKAVHAGDLLVRYDLLSAAQSAEAGQAGVQAAQTRLDAARDEQARQDDLLARGLTPRMTDEAAHAAVQKAQAAVAAATTQAKALATLSDHSRVTAPFDGIVAKCWHNLGDTVQPSPNDPILRLVDPTHVQVLVSVPPATLAEVVPGQTATVTPVMTTAGEPATVVMRSETVTTSATAPAEVRLAFTNPTSLPLDTVVTVEIVLAERAHVVVVPSTTIAHGDDGSTYVMVAGADGRAHRRDVRVGLVAHDRAEIVDGVTSGDELIVGGLADVSENTPISIDRGR